MHKQLPLQSEFSAVSLSTTQAWFGIYLSSLLQENPEKAIPSSDSQLLLTKESPKANNATKPARSNASSSDSKLATPKTKATSDSDHNRENKVSKATNNRQDDSKTDNDHNRENKVNNKINNKHKDSKTDNKIDKTKKAHSSSESTETASSTECCTHPTSSRIDSREHPVSPNESDSRSESETYPIVVKSRSNSRSDPEERFSDSQEPRSKTKLKLPANSESEEQDLELDSRSESEIEFHKSSEVQASKQHTNFQSDSESGVESNLKFDSESDVETSESDKLKPTIFTSSLTGISFLSFCLPLLPFILLLNFLTFC